MAPTTKLRVLVVRSWTSDVEPIVAALRDAAFDAALARVDIEPALHAALGRDRFDAIVHDTATPLPRDAIDAAVRERAVILPVVELDPLHTLGARVADAIARARN